MPGQTTKTRPRSNAVSVPSSQSELLKTLTRNLGNIATAYYAATSGDTTLSPAQLNIFERGACLPTTLKNRDLTLVRDADGSPELTVTPPSPK